MFDDFSFDTASRHPSSLAPPRKLSIRTLYTPQHVDSPLISPTSTPLLEPIAKLPPMDELSRQLSEHSLYSRRSITSLDCVDISRRTSFATGLPTPPNEPVSYPSYTPNSCMSDDDMNDIAGYEDRPLFNRTYSSTNLRKSRQRAVRMQCSVTHLNEIALMVRRRDQCRVGCVQPIPTSDAKLEHQSLDLSLMTPRTPSLSAVDGGLPMDDDDFDSSRSTSSDSESMGSGRASPKSQRCSVEWHGSTARGCISKPHRRRNYLQGKRRS